MPPYTSPELFARPPTVKNQTTDAKHLSLASQADPYEIYQHAVQSPEVDIELIQMIYQSCHTKPAYHLREDFCGTGFTLSHWIQQGDEFTGEGFDLASEPVQWGRKNNFAVLNEAGKR